MESLDTSEKLEIVDIYSYGSGANLVYRFKGALYMFATPMIWHNTVFYVRVETWCNEKNELIYRRV